MKLHRITKPSALLVTLLLLMGSAWGKHKGAEEPPFQYLAGTENAIKGCAGRLQVLKEGLSFVCPSASILMPFSAITMMQYRPDVSKDLLNMNIPWKAQPFLPRTRENKYLAIVWNEQGKFHAVILRVDEAVMRPYFAEIELRSGKSVQEYRSFDEF